MAKKRQALNIALVLDLDQYQKGLSQAKGMSEGQAKAIEGTISGAVGRAALKYLTLQAAVKATEKTIHAFVETSKRLEKEGEGNEGTAAMERLAASADKLWNSFVRATLSSEAIQSIIRGLTKGADFAAQKLAFVGKGVDIIASSLEIGAGYLQRALGKAQAAIGGFIEQVGTYYISVFGAGPDGEGIRSAGLNFQAGGLLRQIDAAAMIGTAQAALTRALTRNPDQESALADVKDIIGAAGPADKIVKEARAALEKASSPAGGAVGEAPENPHDVFMRAVHDGIDSFAASWTAGLERVSQLMATFNETTERNVFGLTESVGMAASDMFQAFATGGNLAQRVFAESETASRIFATAQMTTIGIVAAVHALESGAASLSAYGKGDVGSGTFHAAASLAYAATAAAAGHGAMQAASAGGGGGSVAQQAISNPERYGRERKTVIVRIDNVIGGQEFVRSTIIPEINRAVGEDVVVVSTHATSAARTGSR